MTLPRLGLTIHRTATPTQVLEQARRAEAAGLTDVWVIEDCFFTTGPTLAAAILASTNLHVGIGIMPAVARTAAVTAMEIATLANLAPGRFTAGIGHGVQEWMGQMGVRPRHPVGTLAAVVSAVVDLLDGNEVTMDRHGVVLDAVRLEHPPRPRPRVLAGVRGPASLAAMGEVADGLVLAEPASPTVVRAALEQAGNQDDFEVVAYAPWCVLADDDGGAARARQLLAPWLGDLLDHPTPGITALPFHDDLLDRWVDGGPDALATAPADWWTQLGPVGNPDDAITHLRAVGDAGVDLVSCYPAPDHDLALVDIDTMATVAAMGRQSA